MVNIASHFLMYCVVVFLLAVSQIRSSPVISLDDDVQDIGSPLRVAECRATCLLKFSNNGPGGHSTCLQGPDCFMCWEKCEQLQSNFRVWECEEKEICFPGCQEACRFHANKSAHIKQSQPVIHTKGEFVIRINGAQARWKRPKSVNENTPLVYVVMYHSRKGPWRQIVQTMDLTSRVPINSGQDGSTLRILVVDPKGLVTIYSPVESRESVLKKRKKTINTEKKVNSDNSTIRWQVHLVSLIHQKVLVIGEINWMPKVRKGLYLVTWELDGGGLKGNLFTDTTSATLSLWPDTIYHIQVELISHIPGIENIKSEILDLDTSKAQSVSTENAENFTVLPPQLNDFIDNITEVIRFDESSSHSVYWHQNQITQYVELMAGCAAAILLFVLLFMKLWLCKRIRSSDSDPMTQKLEESFTPTSDYPPIVTTMMEGPERKTKGTNTNFFSTGFKVISTNPTTLFGLASKKQDGVRPLFLESTEDLTSVVKV